MATAMEETVLEPDRLNPTDHAILDLLSEGRINAPYAADVSGKSLDYVRNRIIRLVDHDHVRRVHDGLYELVEDPRDG